MADFTNSGILFPNDKRTSDRSPSMTGKLNVNGKEYRLAAWTKTGQKGKFMSLKISEPDEQRQAAPERPPAPPADLDDEIPW